jgi:cytochrome c-type biogenesis protein
LGAALLPWRESVSRVAGAIIILFGLTMLGVLKLPLLMVERHARIPRFLKIGRPESSALIGMLFAFGWSPCIGPILGTILFVASSTNPAAGALLLAVFSFGLGLPFMLSAIFIDKLNATLAGWGRLTQWLTYVGGGVLVLIGILMFLGDMGLLITWGFGAFEATGYQNLLKYL